MIDYKSLKAGDEIEFTGGRWHWFTNVVENAKKLTVGQKYKVRAIEVASSWCCIKLEEFPEIKFGDDWFSLSFFKYPDK